MDHRLRHQQVITLDIDEDEDVEDSQIAPSRVDPYAAINPIYFSTRIEKHKFDRHMNHQHTGNIMDSQTHFPFMDHRSQPMLNSTPHAAPAHAMFPPLHPAYQMNTLRNVPSPYPPPIHHLQYVMPQQYQVHQWNHPPYQQHIHPSAIQSQCQQFYQPSYGHSPHIRRNNPPHRNFRNSSHSHHSGQIRSQSSSKYSNNNAVNQIEEGEYISSSSPQYVPRRFGSRRHQSYVKVECEPCDRTFYSKSEYEEHIKTTHIKCEVSDCNYSAPIQLLETHQLQHIKGEDGVPILQNKKETELWLQNRRLMYPTKEKVTQANDSNLELVRRPKSALEKMLRGRISLTPMEYAIKQKIMTTSGLYPDLRNVLKRRRQVRCTLPSSLSFFIPGPKGKFTDSQLAKEFPICTNFLNFKKCKWDPCHYSHDIATYRSWKMQRHLRGFDIPMRPPLYYQMILPELKQTESLIFQAINYIVENNFFIEDQQPQAIFDGDSDSLNLSDSTNDQCSPISEISDSDTDAW